MVDERVTIITDAIRALNNNVERLKAITVDSCDFYDAIKLIDDAEQLLDYARATITGHLGSEA